MKRIKVVIESAYRWDYFQWFLLGFYELEKKNEIEFKIKFTPISFLLNIFKNKYICFWLNKLKSKLEKDSYNLKGYIEYENKQKRYFCIDSSDSPFLFDSFDLENVHKYFKIQCPKDLEDNGFHLTDKIKVKWLDHKHVDSNIKNLTDIGERKECANFEKNKFKIKPLMLGPRRLGRSINYKVLKKGYENILKGREANKNQKVMCYFGNAKGPQNLVDTYPVDFDSERNIMGYYKKSVNHPNEKRLKVANLLTSTLGKETDARVINNGSSDTNKIKNKIGTGAVALEKFGEFVGSFEYNFNVSGYRLSIPSRFIDSFSVGTSIITDKLFVRWYKPFEKEEVIETTEMGYLPMEAVNWKSVQEDLLNLPKNNREKVLKCFEEKWKPEVVAQYIINETMK